MLPKNLINDYLKFSKKDRVGIFSLLVLIGLVYVLPSLFPRQASFSDLQIDTLADAMEIEPPSHQPDSAWTYHYRQKSGKDDRRPVKTFGFDPNTLPAEGWRDLGLPERVIRTLLNYRGKGGRFRREEDLQKIWGMPEEVFQRIRKHAIFPEEQAMRPLVSQPSTNVNHEQPERRTAAIYINTADSALLESLPGIGPRLASRIIKFRNRLGGFHSIEQVAETWGLPDSTFQRIRPLLLYSGEVRKINLNTASREEMQEHPYIRWKLAQVIASYRQQHGLFSSLEDLKKILLINDSVWTKLGPYCTIDQP